MSATAYHGTVLRLLRLAILVVISFMTLSLVIAIGGPWTGPAEKVVLAVAVVGLIAAAGPVGRIGSARS